MDDMTILEYLNTFSVGDKLIAAAAVSNTPELLNRDPETFPAEELENINNILALHVIKNGKHGIKMAVLVGRAIKTSIQYPIKKKTGPVQWFKDTIKGMLT
jgi:hypothetical protein